jgi:uncharacterized protein YfaS (alpha-2-macroglobulin family)
VKTSSLLLALILALFVPLSAQTPVPNAAWQKAEKLFKEEHWAEARAAYDEARAAEADWHSAPVRRAVEKAVACAIKLQLWDDALARAAEFVEKTRGSFEEAVGQRFLAGLYLTLPHQGLKQGGKFLRGQSGQGVFVYSWKKDRKEAVLHYERAREVLHGLLAHPQDDPQRDAPERGKLLNAELIGVDFDLATALAQQDTSRWGYGPWGLCGWWWASWGEAEEESDAVEEADYEEPRHYRGWYGGEQETPTGLPLGADGKPRFIEPPKEYSARLGAGPKIRWLLEEIQRLDDSAKKEDAAKALFRWAMIARSLYGPETAQWSGARTTYDRFGRPQVQPPDPDEPKKKIWELADDEALTMAGGKVRVVALPPSESPVALLRQVEEKYPESSSRVEAHYARALYLQTRQQFPQAVEVYQALIAAHPGHPRAGNAQQQIAHIGESGVMLGNSGVQLPSAETRLSFSYRNAAKIDFKAVRFDMVRYTQDRLEQKREDFWEYQNLPNYLFNKDDWKNYVGETVATWSQAVPREPANRTSEGSTVAPLRGAGEDAANVAAPGAYIIEARTAESQVSRVLVLVTDIAMVQKNIKDDGLIYVCDAGSGQPLAEKPVRVYEHWSEYIQTKQKQELHVEITTLTTDADGLVKFKRKHFEHGSRVEAVVAGARNRMAFSFFQNWNEAAYVQGNDENGARSYAITDRPVYRPGSTVKFRVWLRWMDRKVYRGPQPVGENVEVRIHDAKNNEVQKFDLKTDEMGCVSGEYELGAEPPLGIWHLSLNSTQPDARTYAGGLFRVEEYKKPEFEVTVKTAGTQARLGEKIKATIAARYYFGAPVAQGKVSYKVFRENYRHFYVGPGEYDWLYGKGYGRAYYGYPWFPWWGRWGCFWDGGWPWPAKVAYQFPWGFYGEDANDWSRRFESGTRKALRELVAQGEATLKADGTYEVEIDTARAKQEQGDRDHRYTIEAEVRDASRRTIEGKGSVIVTRQEFYAFVETDGGWYRPGNETFVEVRTLTPDNVPVAAKGEVVVARIRYGGADNREVKEEVVKRWDAETDVEGRLSFKQPIPGEGQYRISFKTRDSWKEEVQGNAVFWVSGPKFDGRVYRFNDLEIIADKRTYKIGDTAHLLVNVAENNSRVLFSDNVSHGTLLDWRFIDIPSRSKVIDVPIEARHVPNFFVEATLVRNGRVHTDARELFVPPDRGLLNVTVKADQETYRPGGKGKVRVEVTDVAGKPAQGEVTLTAYDESVTYIQDEFGPSPRVFFYGQKRYHQVHTESSLEHLFSPKGGLRQPENEVYTGSEPEGWRGFWGLEKFGLMLTSGGVVGGMAGSGGAFDTLDLGGRADRAGNFGPMAQTAAAMPASASAPMEFADMSKAAGSKAKSESKADSAPALVEPEIRADFADTALWMPSLQLDAKGVAETVITFPQSLTTWRLHGYAVNRATQVGDAMTKATTTKNLIVRLQAPRFFIERDEVVLSANVNNYLKDAQAVRAELIIPAGLFEFMGPTDKTPRPDADGNLHLLDEANVEANGEHRFDWPVKVLKPGLAKITVKALTTDESDGMRLAFPVLVHGINKQLAQSGSYRVAQDGTRTLKLELPSEIDPEQTRLEVTLSPSLAGVMIDALPYLVGYPYGCVEQTMSRFYPTVLVADTLKKMGTDLETIGKQRRQMNAGDVRNRFGDSPVFDSAELARMTKAGLQRIYSFQRNDGGWGWWREDDSSPHQTAYVLQGLHAARAAGVRVDDGVYDRGFSFLQNSIRKELEKPKEDQQIGDLTTQAYLAYILSLEHRFNDDAKKWLSRLYENRGELNNYGRALLALALQQEKRGEDAKTLLRNLLQFVERDDSNETAWVRTPATHWWFWWNNDIETNAWALKAIVALDPKNDLAPRLVKWLLNNRRNGHYWRSTRDTAQVIAAMTDYMRATGEAAPDYTLTVAIDGQPAKELKVTKDNFFTFDNRILLQGLQIKPGPHEITLTKTGTGALYYSSYLSFFTKEEDVKGAGNEIFVEREYFKLVPKAEQVNLPANATVNTLPANQPVALAETGRTELRAGFTRLPLKTGDAVVSGDQIEVVLKITAKNTYDYLVFEDMKPAGCEPVELRSGGRWAGGLCANLELRDEKVVFFIGLLEQGHHLLRYKLRAETPGRFHALPTAASAMYAPEVRAISDEMRLTIKE